MHDDCITISLGLPEVRVVREQETATEILVEVQYRAQSAPCPRCGEWTPKVHSAKLQRKRDRRLRDKPVFLLLHKRRFRCPGCKKVFTEPDLVCGARRRSSRRFREHTGQEALDQTVRRVAQKEGVGEGLVRRCVTEIAQHLLEAPEEASPARVLGLDEFSIRKGHVYDTAVMDVERKQVLGVVSGHRQKDVQQFLERMPAPEQVEVVVMDMHEPFRQAVELCLPKAAIVVDKFHVMMHINQALDQARLSLHLPEGRQSEVFRSRYLLLAGEERLSPERRARLQALLARYPDLERAWVLKEAFRAWYRAPLTRDEAERALSAWEALVREQGPRSFHALFPMLRRWREQILNYFEHRYTNGFVEGKNNRIKVIKRLAYGYRNRQSFRQRILLTNPKKLPPVVA